MESPAFHGSTIVTTAQVHSPSPPGFIADDKDFSLRGKVKAHNGCVSRENDKIILLKRVYTSPVRRSSRVRRKGRAVLPKSKVKHRHSDPVVYPRAAVRTSKNYTRSYTRSANSTPVRTGNRGVSNVLTNSPASDPMSMPNFHRTANGLATPDSPTTLNSRTTSNKPTTLDFSFKSFAHPDKLTEADFFNPDGTPKRRLTVRITETPEIRKKLAEVGMSLFSTLTDLRETSPKYNVTKDDNGATVIAPLSGDLESNNSECHQDLLEQNTDQCDGRLDTSCQREDKGDDADFLIDKEASASERILPNAWQPVSPGRSNLDFDFDSEETVADRISVASHSSSNSLDIEFEEDQANGGFRVGNQSSTDARPLNGSDELRDVRDPADEVLCISPLPFETPDMDFSFTSAANDYPLLEDEPYNHLQLNLPKYLPLERNQPPDEVDVGESERPSSDETSCNGAPVVNVSPGSSLSSRSPLSLTPVHQGKSNQLGTTVNHASGIQPKFHRAESVSPVNGMRAKQMLLMSLSSPSSRSANRVGVNQSDNQDRQHSVCIVNVTPNHRVFDNLKGKEPSPTYASQANSESPCSPENITFWSPYGAPHSSSAQPPLKNNQHISPKLGASFKIFPNRADDFQDFSEFDFISDKCPPLPQALSPVAVAMNLSEGSLDSIPAVSAHVETAPQCDVAFPQFSVNPSAAKDSSVHLTPAAEDANSVKQEQQTRSKWSEMLEEDAAYREKSAQKSTNVRYSNEQWTSSPDFLVSEQLRSSKKKKTERVTCRRSSMRIAKRMSLLSLETDLKNNEENDSDNMMHSPAPGPLTSKPRKTVSSENSVKKIKTGPKKQSEKKKRRSSTNLSQLIHEAVNGFGVELDKHVVNYVNSSVSSEPTGETAKIKPEVPPSVIPSEPAIEENLRCRFDGDYTVAEDHKTKRKTAKRLNKQSRRRSTRLNPIGLPLIDESLIAATVDSTGSSEQSDAGSESCDTSRPPCISSCSESVSTEEEFQCQFDDADDPMKTRRKVPKRPARQSRRRSARLNPPALPLANESPMADASDAAAVILETIDLERFSSNSKSMASTHTSAAIGQVTETSNPDSCPGDCILEDMQTESSSGFECSLPHRKEKKTVNNRCKRRRSTRLLELAMISLEEEQPTSDQTLWSISSQLEKGNPDNREKASSRSNNPEQCSEKDQGRHSPVCDEDTLCVGDKDNKSNSNIFLTPLGETHSSSSDDGSVDVSLSTGTVDSQSGVVSGDTDAGPATEPEDAPDRRPTRRKLSMVKAKESKAKKHCKKTEEVAVKELYLKRGESKALKPNNLETIFEEVHFSKTGSPLYTGSRKCKRAVSFPEHPWLPRKKRKTPKDKVGRLRGKKAAAKDPNIDEKLEALFAEWTPASPPSALLCCNIDQNQPCALLSGSENPTCGLSENSTVEFSFSNPPRNYIANLLFAEEPVSKKIRQNCAADSETDETVPTKTTKRDTPFKGSRASGSHGAWLKKNNVLSHKNSCIDEDHEEPMQEQ